MKYFAFQTLQREKFSLRAKFKLKPEKMLYGFASCQFATFEFASYIFVSLPIEKSPKLAPSEGQA